MPVVLVSHRYAAPVERVFDAWLTPSLARRFLFATRTGNITQCEMEPQVGGQFSVTDRRPEADGEESVLDVEHRGVFVEIERPRRIVFDFGVAPYTEAFSRVVLEFRADAPQSCEIVLRHDLGEGELAQLYEAPTRQGWTTMLQRLERELFPRRFTL